MASDASMPHCPDCKQPQYACMCEPEDDSVADDKPEPTDTTPRPLTLADVRERIERRIQELGYGTIVPGGSTVALFAASAVCKELTEVLAMLDRVQPGGAG